MKILKERRGREDMKGTMLIWGEKKPGLQFLAEVFFCRLLQQKAGSMATASCKGVWHHLVVCGEKAGCVRECNQQVLYL